MLRLCNYAQLRSPLYLNRVKPLTVPKLLAVCQQMLALPPVPSRAGVPPVPRAAGGETCLYSSICAAPVTKTDPLKGAPTCDVVSSLAWSYPCCPPIFTRPGLRSVGYLPESHPAVTERGGRSKKKQKGKIVAKRNGKASERGYTAGGAEEVEYGERCDDMARAINYPRVGPFIDTRDQGEKTGQVEEGVRKRGQTEQESYMQLEITSSQPHLVMS